MTIQCAGKFHPPKRESDIPNHGQGEVEHGKENLEIPSWCLPEVIATSFGAANHYRDRQPLAQEYEPWLLCTITPIFSLKSYKMGSVISATPG